MKTKAKCGCFSVISFSLFLFVGFQGAGGADRDENWDRDFGVPGAVPYGVSVLAVAGTNLYLGGGMQAVGGVSVSGLAKWDGSSWSSFGDFEGGRYTFVSAIAQARNDLWIGGLFTTVSGGPANSVVRWDGTNWHPLGTGVSGVVTVLAVSGTNLYVGGQFTSAGGSNALRIAKWDGESWSALGAITNVHPNCSDACFDDGGVAALAAQGNDLYVGGQFVYAGDVFATNIAKWDGTNWSGVGGGLDAPARVILAGTDGIYVGGDFRFAGGVRVNHIARWDGLKWNSVGGGVDDDLSVQALAQAGTDLYAGGSFGSIGGVAARRIAKWNGVNWSALGSGLCDFGGGAGVGALANNGTELFVGGYFPCAGGKLSTNIALWHIPHSLAANRSDTSVTLSWPATGTNFVLEAIETLGPTNWTVVPDPRSIVNDQCVVTNEISGGNRFYRLRR